MSSPRRTVRALLSLAAGALAALTLPAAGSAAGLAATPLYGGMHLVSDIGTRCVSGFNATDGSGYYVLTAGPCLDGTSRWSIGGVDLGPSGAAGGDAGVIRVADTTRWDPQPAILSGNGTPARIDRYAPPTVGSPVCTTNESMPVVCGVVTALNVTVSYPEGVYHGLVETTICLPAGESNTGGPVFHDDAAEGVMFGTSGDCGTGGRSYFQPLGPALSAYGLRLV